MNIIIEEMKQLRVAYIRNVGPYGVSNYETMKKIKTWAKDNDLVNDELIILGIAEDDPQITKPEECRYDACAVVDENYHINDSIVSEGRIAGGKYAVFKVEHTAEAVQQAWNSIFEKISNHGCNMEGTRPILERYKMDMVMNGYCEICVPIK